MGVSAMKLGGGTKSDMRRRSSKKRRKLLRTLGIRRRSYKVKEVQEQGEGEEDPLQ
jgi:hypothetical protein